MKLKNNKQKIINNIEKNGYYYYKRINGTSAVSDIEVLAGMYQCPLITGNIDVLKKNYGYKKNAFNISFLFQV